MSAFEESIIQRIKRLEREIERLQRWERPTDGSGVTDHGDLTGLLDDDHPQYLLTTGKAADSDKLDGTDSTGFATATHNHTGTYLPIDGKAADSDKLDGVDITAFKGLHSLTDPNADRVLFWDDSAGALKWLTLGDGLTITDTTIKPSQPQFYPLTTPKTSTDWDGDARSTTSATKIDTSAVFGIPDGVKALIVRVLARDSASFPNTSTYFQIGPASSANNQIRIYPVGGDIMATVTGICNCDANGDIYYSLASSGTETMDCWIVIWGYWL